MLIVNQGVEGPRAIALQILLNRLGGSVVPVQVDGHYGPLTSAAVEAMRKDVLRAPGVGNVADLPVWQFLMRKYLLQTIETVDITDTMLLDTAVPVLQQQNANPIMLAGTSNGIAQLMRLIQLQSTREGATLLLRFHAHGGPGVVAISHGTRKISVGIDPNIELNVLNAMSIGRVREELGSIHTIFANFGFVEFHACRVAEGPKGAEMLQLLADLWQVPVTAPLSKQKAEGDVFKPSGSVRTFYPGGVSLRQWAQSRAEAAGRGQSPLPNPAVTPLMCPMPGQS